MALPDLLHPTDAGQDPALLPGTHVPGHLVPQTRTEQAGLLQLQLKCLICDVLADPAVDPGLRLSLLSCLANTPGYPEQALLIHLRRVQDPEELPPYEFAS
jgi:hypothetical protein